MKKSDLTQYKQFLLPLLLVVLVISLSAHCNNIQESEADGKLLHFRERKIIDSVNLMWAFDPADLTGNGVSDLAFINNNRYGGYLGYFEGNRDISLWEKQVIAQKSPAGETFASGDLECADVDSDGNMDIIAVGHTGEWDDANAGSVVYWYENQNPGWEAHRIGEAPDFVKDMSVVDFDRDKKMDIALLTYENSTLSIFRQKEKENWERIQYFENFKNIHEGMDTGDVDGDGFVDIVANGHIFYNPGENPKEKWELENLDKKWNTQSGDWSRNATKIFMRDINGDDKSEIFISHSERKGYPLSWYELNSNGQWEEHTIKESMPAVHTLQVYDFDLDGDYDVLAGINRGRAQALGVENFDVTLFISKENYRKWEELIIGRKGIYNGIANDYDDDGDYDIFRYPTHDSKKLYLLENTVID